MAALVVMTGKHKGKKITLPPHEVLAGRGEDCFLRLAAEEVSRHHCALHVESQGIRVRDLGSQNGTLLNGARIKSPALAAAGDQLQIGPIFFEVVGVKPREPELDDDIANWLTDSSGSSDNINTFETTLVKPSQLAPAESKPKFHSVKEEADDIIRRYREQKNSGER